MTVVPTNVTTTTNVTIVTLTTNVTKKSKKIDDNRYNINKRYKSTNDKRYNSTNDKRYNKKLTTNVLARKYIFDDKCYKLIFFWLFRRICVACGCTSY